MHTQAEVVYKCLIGHVMKCQHVLTSSIDRWAHNNNNITGRQIHSLKPWSIHTARLRPQLWGLHVQEVCSLCLGRVGVTEMPSGRWAQLTSQAWRCTEAALPRLAIMPFQLSWESFFCSRKGTDRCCHVISRVLCSTQTLRQISLHVDIQTANHSLHNLLNLLCSLPLFALLNP